MPTALTSDGSWQHKSCFHSSAVVARNPYLSDDSDPTKRVFVLLPNDGAALWIPEHRQNAWQFLAPNDKNVQPIPLICLYTRHLPFFSLKRGNNPLISSRTNLAPSRSWISAAWTTTFNNKPMVSTTMWRLRPLTFFQHRTPVVLPVQLS